MKYIFTYAIILCTLMASCNQNGKNADQDNGDRPTSEGEKDKKITSRDISITPAIAYNNLFLDSATVEKFLAASTADEKVKRRMKSFYNARNYQYAWFSSDGLTEQARGFWNVFEYYSTQLPDNEKRDKQLEKRMDNLIAEENISIAASDKQMANTELVLTQNFLEYSLNTYEKGYVKRKELERFIPIKKESVLELADSLLNKKHKDNKYFEDVNESYKLLKAELARYYNIAKKGGWPTVTAEAKQLKKGTTSPAVAMLKKRLQITGDMVAGDTSQVFNDTLANGIKKFQTRHGYKPDGVITSTLLKEMNIPVELKLKQLVINMGRMRWMPAKPEGKLIIVNIPEFVLHVTDGQNRVFDMNVVVGKEGHNTMMFTGNLNQVVFSPYWNVPPSIVKNEIMPALERNPDYLNRNNMEMKGEEQGLPVVRQLPGPKNSLGKVKFLFPNSYNIYFHDTPAKSLFNQDRRAYSHGCIRLSDPTKMANYLLQNDPSWTPEKINEAMNAGEEKFVRLKNAVPVFITYYTAWVDEKGLLNFRDDIYDHDQKLATKMFFN